MCTQERGDSIYSMKTFAEEFVEIFDEIFDESDTLFDAVPNHMI